MNVARKGGLTRPKFSYENLSHYPLYHIPSPKGQKEFFAAQKPLGSCSFGWSSDIDARAGGEAGGRRGQSPPPPPTKKK